MGTLLQMVKKCAATQKRNYVCMQVKSNLIKDEREELLKMFPNDIFRKVAQVQVGEPDMEFKKRVQETTLKNKQAVSDAEFRKQKQEEKNKRQAERQKRITEKKMKKAA